MDGQEFSEHNANQSRNDKWDEQMEAMDDDDEGTGNESSKNQGKSPRRRKSNEKERATGKKRTWQLSRNPFIIFYLRIFSKSPGKHVTEVAREAAKKWCVLPDQKKQKYINLARKEQIKRQKRKEKC